jgi:hypothetical protein
VIIKAIIITERPCCGVPCQKKEDHRPKDGPLVNVVTESSCQIQTCKKLEKKEIHTLQSRSRMTENNSVGRNLGKFRVATLVIRHWMTSKFGVVCAIDELRTTHHIWNPFLTWYWEMSQNAKISNLWQCQRLYFSRFILTKLKRWKIASHLFYFIHHNWLRQIRKRHRLKHFPVYFFFIVLHSPRTECDIRKY